MYILISMIQLITFILFSFCIIYNSSYFFLLLTTYFFSSFILLQIFRHSFTTFPVFIPVYHNGHFLLSAFGGHTSSSSNTVSCFNCCGYCTIFIINGNSSETVVTSSSSNSRSSSNHCTCFFFAHHT